MSRPPIGAAPSARELLVRAERRLAEHEGLNRSSLRFHIQQFLNSEQEGRSADDGALAPHTLGTGAPK